MTTIGRHLLRDNWGQQHRVYLGRQAPMLMSATEQEFSPCKRITELLFMNKGSVKMIRRNDESQFMSLLKEKNKTPEDVAAALDVNVRTVYFWLSGERSPRFSIDQIQKLCTLLECSVFDLPTDFSRSKSA